jgi:hypothetical protein
MQRSLYVPVNWLQFAIHCRPWLVHDARHLVHESPPWVCLSFLGTGVKFLDTGGPLSRLRLAITFSPPAIASTFVEIMKPIKTIAALKILMVYPCVPAAYFIMFHLGR